METRVSISRSSDALLPSPPMMKVIIVQFSPVSALIPLT
jgi:hypothetical protein